MALELRVRDVLCDDRLVEVHDVFDAARSRSGADHLAEHYRIVQCRLLSNEPAGREAWSFDPPIQLMRNRQERLGCSNDFCRFLPRKAGGGDSEENEHVTSRITGRTASWWHDARGQHR